MMQIAPVTQAQSTLMSGSQRSSETSRLVLVVEDGTGLTSALEEICDFLGVGLERVGSHCDLTPILYNKRPMGIVAEMDSSGQDGCHILKTVAVHDKTLPVLLLTGPDPELQQAAQAVEEVWGLSTVRREPSLPSLGSLVEFLCDAGRKGRCLGVIPV